MINYCRGKVLVNDLRTVMEVSEKNGKVTKSGNKVKSQQNSLGNMTDEMVGTTCINLA